MEMLYSYSVPFLKSQDYKKNLHAIRASPTSLIHEFDLQCKFANFKTNPFRATGSQTQLIFVLRTTMM